MKTLTRFVRTTILGGVFFLIPIVVLSIVIAKALEYTNKALRILANQILAASELSATGARSCPSSSSRSCAFSPVSSRAP